MIMNFLDRAVMAVSPQRGLARVRARARASVIMNYDAASKGRRTYNWKSPATAADAAAFGTRGQLRNLSRDMIRNRPYAARAQMVVTGNVVGAGITPSVDCTDEAVKKEVGDLIKRHMLSTSIDAYGVSNMAALQRQVMNAVFSDGEVLVRQRPKSGVFARGLVLPFRIQVMEVDHLDQTMTSHGANEVREGIEYSPIDTVVAYHMFDQHPGDIARWSKRKLTSVRVPAAQVLHIRRTDRPGQTRGVPWLAPAMMTLGELSDYQEAQILKQRMAALMAFFVESEPDGEKFDGKGIDEVAPGALIGLTPGQKMVPTQPPEVSGYDLFMKQGLRAVAMAIGITYEAASGDLEGVNFSSGRMGRMEMDKLVETWQQQIIIDQFCEGVSAWFRDFARLVSRCEDYTIQWTAPRRALIDPTKEVPAILKAIDGGLTSRQREQRRLGYDPETIRAERLEDAAAAALENPAPPAADNAPPKPAEQQQTDPEELINEGQ